MEFIHTPEWYELVGQMGKKYETFKYYVDCEIESATKPFAFMNETVILARDILTKIKQFISVIDVDKLKDYDFTELLNTLGTVMDASEKKATQEVKNDNKDNIVSINKT